MSKLFLSNKGGYKYNQLKGRSYDEIQKLFDKKMKRVNSFVAMNSEAHEISGKKDESSSKKTEITQDSTEMKMHMVIVKDDDIAIDAIPLATKPPMIVEYKLIKEGRIGHYQLIRADGSSKRYSFMIRMLQGIDREDLETLWKLVKTKHGNTRPDEHERVLWGDLKVMFEPDYMIVFKRDSPHTITITNMLNKKLQADYWNEMCYQLLKLWKNKIELLVKIVKHIEYLILNASPLKYCLRVFSCVLVMNRGMLCILLKTEYNTVRYLLNTVGKKIKYCQAKDSTAGCHKSQESKTSRHVKRGRDTKIPQSSGPSVKVGDEAVHKELGDRMERAATTV
ncbi:hypothetical protein Tco_0300461 [Tanacetum coccineum]